jgi:hypothetical protein
MLRCQRELRIREQFQSLVRSSDFTIASYFLQIIQLYTIRTGYYMVKGIDVMMAQGRIEPARIALYKGAEVLYCAPMSAVICKTGNPAYAGENQ